jgi:hypothetical protein
MQQQLSTPEEWRAIPGWEGRYEVSDQGRVRSLRFKNGRVDRPRPAPLVLSHHTAKTGYVVVGLPSSGKSRTFPALIHRLVLEAFVGPCPDGMECAHENGIRDDNRVSNLRWDTRAGNHADKDRHGTAQRGENASHHKLFREQVVEIRARYSAGTATQDSLAAEFGVRQSHIYRIIHRKVWRHV